MTWGDGGPASAYRDRHMARLGGPDALPARGRPDGRAVAVVVVAAGCVLALALLSGQRLLVADPLPDDSLASDEELARALAGRAVDPTTLDQDCLDEGRVDLRCLDDGRLATGEVERPEVRVIPAACRATEPTVDPDCLAEELGIDVPVRCRTGPAGVDVACLAGERTVLAIDPACDDDGRFGPGCLGVRRYGLPGPATDATTTTTPGATTTTTTTPSHDTVRDETENPFLDWLLGLAVWATLAVVVGLVIGGIIVLVLRSDWGRALRGLEPRNEAPPLDPADAAHDRTVMAESLAAGAGELDLSDDPRGAIIAAYAALLTGLETCAQGRRPAETPDEHLARVLAALDVRPEPLRELTTLFGEARFSDHVMTEAQRDRARAALGAAEADLARFREPEAVR